MKTPLDKQVYVGLMEILKDKRFYYQSGVSYYYNHFTDEGKEAIAEFMSIMAPHMVMQYEKELDDRAKSLVMQELKS